jgi:hypothetical protein
MAESSFLFFVQYTGGILQTNRRNFPYSIYAREQMYFADDYMGCDSAITVES